MRNVRAFDSCTWFAAAALAAAMASGCGSDSRQVKAPPVEEDAARTSAAVAESQAQSIANLKAELIRGNAEIDNVLGTLNKLMNPAATATDLRATFDLYSEQLARMTQRSERLRQEAEQMRDARAAYFAKWDAKTSEIDNPSLRASAEERKARLRAAHERITTDALAARDAYDPFMRDLRDVRKFLGGELDPASVRMLGDVARQATDDGAVVKQRVSTVIADLDAVEGTAAH